MDTEKALKILISVSGLWHIIAFGFGLVYVRLSLLSLLGRTSYDNGWTKVLKCADINLWLSGILIIILGIIDKGVGVYLYNPKLWSKITIVIIWAMSTFLMRSLGVKQLKLGNNTMMLFLSAISLSCWLYGAFLGCAKLLGYGVVTYSELITGFFAISVLLISYIFIQTRMGVYKFRFRPDN